MNHLRIVLKKQRHRPPHTDDVHRLPYPVENKNPERTFIGMHFGTVHIGKTKKNVAPSIATGKSAFSRNKPGTKTVRRHSHKRLTTGFHPSNLGTFPIMKKSLILPLLLATATTGFGQLYFGAGGAYFFPEADTSTSNAFTGGDMDPEDGFGGIANVGYKIPSNGWHFEFEFQYYKPDSEASVTASGAQSAAITGTNLGTGQYNIKTDADNYAFLGNVYYNFLATMETNWGIYMGGGLGAINLVRDVTVTGPGGSVEDDNNKWLFTYQFLAGISYQPIENIRFDFAYRYTIPEDANFTVFNRNVGVDDYEYESIELSASFTF